MQMAKTSAAIARLREAAVPLISVLLHPTTGGVAASFAMLGDFIVAEPKALIGFAGARVIQNTIRQSLPPGFQRAEFLLQHGFVDCIAHRKELKATLARMLRFLTAAPGGTGLTAARLRQASSWAANTAGCWRGWSRCASWGCCWASTGCRPPCRRWDRPTAPAGRAHRRHQRQGIDRGDGRVHPAAGGPAHGPVHLAAPQPVHRAHPDRRPGGATASCWAGWIGSWRPPACR